ncbi:hypothetical protein NKG94_15295 [Micromonospora sp. M12]
MTPPLRIVLAVLLAGGVVAVGQAGPATAAPTDAAFGTGTGTLNVNRAGYLAKHDIVYNRPNTNPCTGSLSATVAPAPWSGTRTV